MDLTKIFVFVFIIKFYIVGLVISGRVKKLQRKIGMEEF